MSGGKAPQGLGSWGEALVAEDLREKGWTIQTTNYRCRYGEIDIVAEGGGFLAFVEVKLRKNDRFAPARMFVTGEKQRKLRAAAELYLTERPTDLQPRFDVVEVYAPEGRETRHPRIIYIENAF